MLEPPAKKTLAITFDDCFCSVLEIAFPILERMDLPGTVFVPTAFAGRPRPMSWGGNIDCWLGGPHEHELLPMSWEELGALARSGWEIGSHTRSHPRLTGGRDLVHDRLHLTDRLRLVVALRREAARGHRAGRDRSLDGAVGAGVVDEVDPLAALTKAVGDGGGDHVLLHPGAQHGEEAKGRQTVRLWRVVLRCDPVGRRAPPGRGDRLRWVSGAAALPLSRIPTPNRVLQTPDEDGRANGPDLSRGASMGKVAQVAPVDRDAEAIGNHVEAQAEGTSGSRANGYEATTTSLPHLCRHAHRVRELSTTTPSSGRGLKWRRMFAPRIHRVDGEPHRSFRAERRRTLKSKRKGGSIPPGNGMTGQLGTANL